MSQTGMVSWSKTAANNASSDSAVNMAEGMAPSAVNDGVRAAMASGAMYRDDTAGSLVTATSSTAYTCSTNQNFSALSVLSGQELKVRFHTTNGSSPTLNVDGLGAKAITIDGATAVPAGALVTNTIWGLTYSTVAQTFTLHAFPQAVGSLSLTGNLSVGGTTTLVGSLNASTASVGNLTVGGTFTFTLPGKSLAPGDIVNGTIQQSTGGNAVTFSLKTLAGADPSSTDPVLICYRNSTASLGDYVYRTIYDVTSVRVSSGSTLGTATNTPFNLWLTLSDSGTGSTIMGVINCLNSTNIFPLKQLAVSSTTAEGGSGGADSNQVLYANTAIGSRPYVVIGRCEYSSGLATPGTYTVGPDRIRLRTEVGMPGDIAQVLATTYSTPSSTTFSTSFVSTNTFSVTVIPTSAANLIRLAMNAPMSATGGGSPNFVVLSKGGTTSIGASVGHANAGINMPVNAVDNPNTTAAINYGYMLKCGTTNNVAVPYVNSVPATYTIEEIVA